MRRSATSRNASRRTAWVVGLSVRGIGLSIIRPTVGRIILPAAGAAWVADAGGWPALRPGLCRGPAGAWPRHLHPGARVADAAGTRRRPVRGARGPADARRRAPGQCRRAPVPTRVDPSASPPRRAPPASDRPALAVDASEPIARPVSGDVVLRPAAVGGTSPRSIATNPGDGGRTTPASPRAPGRTNYRRTVDRPARRWRSGTRDETFDNDEPLGASERVTGAVDVPFGGCRIHQLTNSPGPLPRRRRERRRHR